MLAIKITKWGTKKTVVYNTPKRPEIIDVLGGNNHMKDYGWILVIQVLQDIRQDMTVHRHPSLIFFAPPATTGFTNSNIFLPRKDIVNMSPCST